jgi:very-short-patch-repair endonuclease
MKVYLVQYKGYKPSPANRVKFKQHQVFGIYTTDFYFPQHKIDLEIDGEYWHDSVETQEKDKRKKQFLKTLGIRVVVLKGKTLKKDPAQSIRKVLTKAGIL